MSIKKGEVYVPIGRNKQPDYALAILHVDGEVFCYLNTRNDCNEFYCSDTRTFLASHQLATPEQLEPMIKSLKGQQELLARKTRLLETFAQTSPKCTRLGKEVLSSLARVCLKKGDEFSEFE